MRFFSSEELIDEFYKKYKEENPDFNLDRKDFNVVIHSMWEHIKDTFKSGSFLPIRLQYFGRFQVKKNRAEYLKNSIPSLVEKGRMSEEEGNKRIENYTNYINKVDNGEIKI